MPWHGKRNSKGRKFVLRGGFQALRSLDHNIRVAKGRLNGQGTTGQERKVTSKTRLLRIDWVCQRELENRKATEAVY